jgi:hypothetical protein
MPVYKSESAILNLGPRHPAPPPMSLHAALIAAPFFSGQPPAWMIVIRRTAIELRVA